MDAGALAQAAALVQARRPFALATVVWRRAPSSGHVGSKGIVMSEGTVRGWLGGACAEPTVVREALASLVDGRARLLFLGSPDELAAHDHDETLTVAMACESEGAMEIYLEPFLPKPQVVVFGRSPAVHALTLQARSLDWDVAVTDGASIDGLLRCHRLREEQ
jgi:xanthine dehydrogenase accessory factor